MPQLDKANRHSASRAAIVLNAIRAAPCSGVSGRTARLSSSELVGTLGTLNCVRSILPDACSIADIWVCTAL